MKVKCLSKVHTLINSPEDKKPLWFFLYCLHRSKCMWTCVEVELPNNCQIRYDLGFLNLLLQIY